MHKLLVVSLWHSGLSWEPFFFMMLFMCCVFIVFVLFFNICPVSTRPLEENEVRTMVDPNSKNDRKLQELMKVNCLLDTVRLVSLCFVITSIRGCNLTVKTKENLHSVSHVSVIVLHRCWSTGSMTFWWERGSLWRIWLRICMMDRCCRNCSVRNWTCEHVDRKYRNEPAAWCMCLFCMMGKPQDLTLLTLELKVCHVRSCVFTEKLEGEKLNVAEVTQSEIAQKQKLQTVLERINDSLKLSTRNIRWNVDCKKHLLMFPSVIRSHFNPTLFSTLIYFWLFLPNNSSLSICSLLHWPLLLTCAAQLLRLDEIEIWRWIFWPSVA